MPRTEAVHRMLHRGVSAFFWLAVAALAPAQAYGGSCTDSVDCYCDKVKSPSNSAYDNKLLACEDFEAPQLTQNVNLGNSGPDYGPWYDDTGSSGLRGLNSYWGRNYGPPNSTCAWHSSSPSPTLGSACAYENCYGGEWSAGDPWTSNSFACLDVLRDGEFNDEVSTLPAPLLPGGGSGVFAGQQTMGFRVNKGQNMGITGEASLGKAVTEVGVTMALAYAANVADSGVWNYPWKHDEWSGPTNKIEFWNMGNTGNGEAPYSPFMFHTGKAGCQTALANATLTIGSAFCSDVALHFGAGAPQFVQSRDFPWGTWGCHRSHIRGMGTTNTELRIWHNEVLIFELTGFDGTKFYNQSYNHFLWNHYSNANEPANQALGVIPTTETTYRYQDNVHVREGVPVSCQDIGYAGIPPSAPPPPLLPPQAVPEAPILLD